MQLLGLHVLQLTPFSYSEFLLLTQPHRPTLDVYFHNPFYVSLVYMHPQCMIFNLNLMPPSQSKHSLYEVDGFFSHTFQFFIFHKVKDLSRFSLSVQINLVNPTAYKISFSNYLLVYQAQNVPSSECTKLQLWWLSIFTSFFNTLKSIFTFILFISFNHFHCMTSPP